MLKALKGFKKRLGGSSSKLQEERQSEEAPSATAQPAAAAYLGAEASPPPAPVRAGLLPRPPAQHAAPAAEGGHHAATPPAAAAAAAEQKVPAAVAQASTGPLSSPSQASASAAEPLAEGPGVDYQLVVGPVELDCAAPQAAEAEAEAPLAGQRDGEQPAAAAAHDAAQHAEHGEVVCYDGGAALDSPGAHCAEEAAAAAAVLAESEGGGGDGDGLAGAAGGGDSVAGPSTEAEPISDALATMMYLTEDAEGQEDCVSVVSGGPQVHASHAVTEPRGAPMAPGSPAWPWGLAALWHTGVAPHAVLHPSTLAAGQTRLAAPLAAAQQGDAAALTLFPPLYRAQRASARRISPTTFQS